MKQHSGFTLIELMLTVALLGIVVAIGVPAMGDFVRNSRLTSSVNDFIAATTIGRSEAIKRRSAVTVCASDDSLATTPACDTGAGTSWEKGWVVFVDTDGDAVIDSGEQILQRQGPLAGNVLIRADDDLDEYISFNGAGRTRDTSGDPVNGDLIFCDERGIVPGGGASAARRLNISPTGRAQSFRQQSEVTAPGISCP